MATPRNSTCASRIAVVEPTMEEHFHAPFNAALLHTAALAHPGVPVSFQAFPSHACIVRQILSQHDPAVADSIDWRTVPAPTAKGTLSRFLETRRMVRAAASSSSDRVLFTSISRTQLLHLKRFLKGNKRHTVRAVIHGDLERVGVKIKEPFPNNLIPIERVLFTHHPGNLRYLVLSESILRNIPSAFRAAVAECAAIDHPYHFPAIDEPAPAQLSFGIFGNSGEAHLLEQVARSVKAIDRRISFRLVGSVSDRETVERLSPLVEGVTHVPLDRDTFIERARNISHALWLAPPDSYRLRASGTFFDALAYGKPIIYTANPYIDPYYAAEPAIGVRCDTIDNVTSAILETIRAYTPAGYTCSQHAMERLRRRFTPQEQALGLTQALDW
jgi:hypothetical protein